MLAVTKDFADAEQAVSSIIDGKVKPILNLILF